MKIFDKTKCKFAELGQAYEIIWTHAQREDVFQVTIESSDLQLKVLSLGAIIQDIRMRNVTHSLVLGYPRLEPYFINLGKLGAIVGRYANRISHGKAKIDGKFIPSTKIKTKPIHCMAELTDQLQKLENY